DKVYVAYHSGVGVIDAVTDNFTPISGVDSPYPLLSQIGINAVTNEVHLPNFATGRLNIVKGAALSVEFVNYPAGSEKPLDIAINENENKAYLTMIRQPNSAYMGILILDRRTGGVKFVGSDDLEPLAFNQTSDELFSGVQVGVSAAV